MIKVGYLYYWIATVLVSVLVYFLLKLVFYSAICSKLGFGTVTQPYLNPLLLILLLLSFTLTLISLHLYRIHTNPLS